MRLFGENLTAGTQSYRRDGQGAGTLRGMKGAGALALEIHHGPVHSRPMGEIAAFVNRGASTITPAVVEKVLRHLPQWKLEFTQIREPQFPHLVDQLEFLADAVEDVAEGAYKDLPYYALAQATFALIYAHKRVGIIPDSILNLGRADDSAVVRAVLIQNEKAFALYAASRNLDWSRITSEP